MIQSKARNADAWGLPGVVEYFSDNRNNSRDVYPSEWRFLSGLLKENIRILDVGCARGGFAEIIGEHVRTFEYIGVDINPEMISRAREKLPQHEFHVVEEGAFEVRGAPFDLVLVLGILHLHEAWRDTLAAAWAHTSDALLFDLRETDRESVEDAARAYMRMDFGATDARHAEVRLPYNIINENEAKTLVSALCENASSIDQFGYRHATTSSAAIPYPDVIARVWCARR